MIYEIIVDAGETPNKCTIAPLGAREDFRLFPVFGEGPLGPLSAPLLLHHEGQCLAELRNTVPAVPAIASVDCVWRRLPRLVERIAWTNNQPPILARIPEGFQTVYPRVGLPGKDPQGGLATIEAIFIAAAMLGNYDPTLLSHYYFARQFIEQNTRRFLELGIEAVDQPHPFPAVPGRARDSLTRRRNRGRVPKTARGLTP
jgi:pre-rRNA-processing protein TSR3